MTRSTWSGGVTWSGTGKWMPDGLTASGPLVPAVAIGGTLRTGLQTASWRLGITDFLAELSPGSCSLSFAGDVTATPGDSIVLSIPDGTLWVGRVDSYSNMRDPAGNEWTTITGMDSLGALASAVLAGDSESGSAHDLEDQAEYWATVVGVELDIVDDSASGLANIIAVAAPLSGDVLGLINSLARQSNAMLALTRDGTVHAVVRESVTVPTPVVITDRYSERSKTIALTNDINRWAAAGDLAFGSDDADVALYGQRTYAIDLTVWSGGTAQFDDWIAYGGSQRAIRSYTAPMKAWTDTDLMLLDPFDWVTADGIDYQIMGMEHSVSVSPPLWTVKMDVDNLLDLL